MSQQLKDQIAGLQRKLAKLEVNAANSSSDNGGSSTRAAKRRRRRERARLGLSGVSGGVVAPVVQNPLARASGMGRRRRRGAGSNAITSDAGAITVSRCEFVAEVKKDSDYFVLSPLRLPWLKGLAASFDRYVWLKAHIVYKAAVGTTKSGLVAVGPDWDSYHSTSYSRQDVLAYTPVYESPVWQSGRLALPPSRLMTRKEYRLKEWTSQATEGEVFDLFPCVVVYNCSGTETITYGEIWVEYTVRLIGTKKV